MMVSKTFIDICTQACYLNAYLFLPLKFTSSLVLTQKKKIVLITGESSERLNCKKSLIWISSIRVSKACYNEPKFQKVVIFVEVFFFFHKSLKWSLLVNFKYLFACIA